MHCSIIYHETMLPSMGMAINFICIFRFFIPQKVVDVKEEKTSKEVVNNFFKMYYAHMLDEYQTKKAYALRSFVI